MSLDRERTPASNREMSACVTSFVEILPPGKMLSPIIHLGQDEATYKAFCLPADSWSMDDFTFLRPKSDGPGLMLSAFVGAPFHFGMPIPEGVLDALNAARRVTPMRYACADSAVAVGTKLRTCRAAREAYEEEVRKARAVVANATTTATGVPPTPEPLLPTDPTMKIPMPKIFLFEENGVRYFQSPALATLRIGKQHEGWSVYRV